MKYLSILLLAAVSLSFAQPKTKPSEQGEKGRELFAKSAKGTPCAACHVLVGVGTAVGPDLTKLGQFAMPKGFVTAMRMSMTETVQLVKPQTGNPFPAVLKAKTGDKIEVWDLSQTPPVLKTFESAQIASMTRDDKWKHPPSQAGYSSEELASIVAFVKWASTGVAHTINVDDIETSK
jgi:hypothetical protein